MFCPLHHANVQFGKLSSSFHTSGKNGRLDLSLPWCTSWFPTVCAVHGQGNLDKINHIKHYNKTIKICSEAFYDKSDSQPIIPKVVFVKLMKSATSSVKFSFKNTMYMQTDRVAMGLPLGLALANIFVGYYEEKLFSQT